MKILLQSTLFFPSIGGIESVSMCLANHYVALGHSCTVITRSVADNPDSFPFQISRNPSLKEKLALLRSHDILHCNGASMELVFWAKLLGKPIFWTHAGYQLISIDGLGWHQGEASPLEPFGSFRFHARKQGFTKAIKEYGKLLIRQIAARLVTQHIAITQWVNNRQPFKGQVIIYNPFPINRFAEIKEEGKGEYDFFFLGRLVSEKGVETLLKAFKLFLSDRPDYKSKLLIIGDGSWREHLTQLAEQLGIYKQVEFVGKQTGVALLQWVSKGKIAIIPSEWEEPMGGVALEMLAAGKPVIVSLHGGLAECVGNAGLTFPNGDARALKAQMEKLYSDRELQEELRSRTGNQILKFDEVQLTKQYISLFEKWV